MKEFKWSKEKNEWLKARRNLNFELVEILIKSNKLLAKIDHYNRIKHPNQKLFILNSDSYALVVPFLETEDSIFLKTAYYSRKYTKIYLLNKKE